MLSGTKLLVALALGILGCLVLSSFLWGILLLAAGISIMAGAATAVDSVSKKRKVGTRLFIWFLNRNFLLEVLGLALGIIAGGTGTIAGIKLAIMTGVLATVFRLLNAAWRGIEGKTAMETLHTSSLPAEWRPDEPLRAILLPRKRR